ncbi:hypothetical protein [Streptomyces sp. NPDC001828]|uniref:hypothetical protein n=1 Tax=Streptomyces sp. NPDC001828 TaxID=3364615 RepID=UPI0036A1A731
MPQISTGDFEDRVLGRTWTVRLDSAGRGSAAVRVSCSRPACPTERLPSAAAGRAAAVAHLKAHLKAVSGPRAQAFCACKVESCQAHSLARRDDRPERGEPWRCGGPVVLAVVTDREGRWWRVTECCSRCAAATPGARTIGTAPPALRATAAATPADTCDHPTAAPACAPQFSDPSSAGSSLPVPTARSVPRRPRPPRDGRIAGQVVPHSLRPVELRDELTELGDLFRAYQQRTEPDLALLAGLQTRKATAFTTWSALTDDPHLRREARRAEQAAQTARLQHQQRTHCTDSGEPALNRVLTGAALWEHARTALAYCAGHCPLPGPETRLVVVMLTLRTAHTGTGNLVGQDLTGLGLSDPGGVVEQLAGCGWLSLPASVESLLESRPENPTPVTIPSLLPNGEGPVRSGSAGRRARSSAAGPRKPSPTTTSARRRRPPPPACSP